MLQFVSLELLYVIDLFSLYRSHRLTLGSYSLISFCIETVEGNSVQCSLILTRSHLKFFIAYDFIQDNFIGQITGHHVFLAICYINILCYINSCFILAYLLSLLSLLFDLVHATCVSLFLFEWVKQLYCYLVLVIMSLIVSSQSTIHNVSSGRH